MTTPLLVTGGAGFIGCNLADRLAGEGHPVLVFDSLARSGVEENLAWLRRRHPRLVSVARADVRDESAVTDAVGACAAVFHLAGQVAVTASLQAPADDFAVNAQGTLTVLEAVRRRHGGVVPIVFASTNKVYGDLADLPLAMLDGRWQPREPTIRARGVTERRPLDFHTPYGCSKGAADQYVLDYARSFGLPATVLRMSCIYGTHQRGTEDQGWVAHFLIRALAGEPVTVFGDGRQVRDVLFVDDAVAAYLAAWRRIDVSAGRAFNLGGGPANAVSLRDVLARAQQIAGRTIAIRWEGWRPGDQRWFVADTTALRAALGLAEPIRWQDGVAQLADWLARDGLPALETAA